MFRSVSREARKNRFRHRNGRCEELAKTHVRVADAVCDGESGAVAAKSVCAPGQLSP